MDTAYTLYRVSTKKQVDKQKDDISMQREACRDFAERMGWTIGKEFLEKGDQVLRCRQITVTQSRT